MILPQITGICNDDVFFYRRQIKNLFLPLTQDSGAISLQFVSFWHAVYLGPLNAYPLSQ